MGEMKVPSKSFTAVVSHTPERTPGPVAPRSVPTATSESVFSPAVQDSSAKARKPDDLVYQKLDSSSEANRMANEGYELYKAGQLAAALGKYNDALRADPTHVTALVRKGVALGKMGHLDEARRLYSEVLVHQPDHGGAMYNIGWTHLKQGEVDLGFEWIERSVVVNPDKVEVMKDVLRRDSDWKSYPALGEHPRYRALIS